MTETSNLWLNLTGYGVIVLFVALMLILSGYILVEYSHDSEKQFTGSFATKVLIVWGASLSMTLLLSMAIDILSAWK